MVCFGAGKVAGGGLFWTKNSLLASAMRGVVKSWGLKKGPESLVMKSVWGRFCR